MRNIFTLLLLTACSTTFAQIKKADKLLGGSFSVSFLNYSQNTVSQSNTNVTPYFQFAYKDNRTIGFAMGFNYFDSKNNGQKSTQMIFTPEVNFNQYHNIKGRLGWYLQEAVGASFVQSTENNGTQETKNKYWGINGGVVPGIYFTPGEKQQWLLHASIGGAGAAYNGSNGDYSWSAYTSLFKNFQFGFAYIISK